eukprot:maker-scaffold158_size296719-snap-gene-1.19 protein:Tk05688 transcript:maker-scaffold158_size296719-snap-gene-1.19-mRNA-1 annotation:"hypothetical protein Y032_0065g3677"
MSRRPKHGMTWNNSQQINFFANRSNDIPDLDPEAVLRFVSEGLVNTLLSILGWVGNAIAVFILLTKKVDLHGFLRHILIYLAIFDSVFLLATFALYSLPLLSEDYQQYLYKVLAPKFLIPISQIALTGSVYSVIAITIERYLATCHPQFKAKDDLKTSAWTGLAILTFSLGYNLSRFFEYQSTLELVPYQDFYIDKFSGKPIQVGQIYSKSEHRLEATNLRTDSTYVMYYLLLGNGLVMTFGPIALLLVLNWKIHQAVKLKEQRKALLLTSNGIPSPGNSVANHSGRFHGTSRSLNNSPHTDKETTVTKILVAIVVIFIVCHSVKVVLVVLEIMTMLMHGTNFQAGWMSEILMNLNHVALAFNASVNVIIYIHKDRQFRNAVKPPCPSSSEATWKGRSRQVLGEVKAGSPWPVIHFIPPEALRVAWRMIKDPGENNES